MVWEGRLFAGREMGALGRAKRVPFHPLLRIIKILLFLHLNFQSREQREDKKLIEKEV